MYLPKDKKFTLYFRTLTVPGRQPNQSKRDWLADLRKSRKRGGNQNIESGEHTFEVEIRRNPVPDEHWELEFHTLGEPSHSTVGVPGLTDRRAWTITADPALDKQKAINPEDGLVLFSLREGTFTENKGRYTTIKPDDAKEVPGVILWIAPAEDNSRN
jgi:hypothetical protein